MHIFRCVLVLSDALVFAGHSEKGHRPCLWRKAGRGAGSGPTTLVLNSSGPFPGLLFPYLLSISSGFGFGILLMQINPSFFCKQATFLRWGGTHPHQLWVWNTAHTNKSQLLL